MSTNFIASLLVSTTLLAVCAGVVVVIPGTITTPQQTASHITWQ